MSIPRITLWTEPLIVPVRLVKEQPFRRSDGRRQTLAEQTRAIQKSDETIKITPGAMYILSTIAGRRIVEPIRWVLLDSLRDILTEIYIRSDRNVRIFSEPRLVKCWALSR